MEITGRTKNRPKNLSERIADRGKTFLNMNCLNIEYNFEIIYKKLLHTL